MQRFFGSYGMTATTVLAILLLALPLRAQAAETENLCQSVGVASFFEADLTEEEYVAIADAAQGAYWGYTNLGMADTQGDYLNVRETPSTSGKLAGRMADHAACEILEIQDGWAKITSGKVEGYVSCEYLLTGLHAVEAARKEVRAVVISQADGLNLRREPELGGKSLKQIRAGEKLEFVEYAGEWIHVKWNGEDAYVYGEYAEVAEELTEAMTMAEVLYGKEVSEFRAELAEFAKQFVGNPYVWGGTSLTNGADCSGFVQSVFRNFGISLDRTASAQSKNGTAVEAGDLLPGDLIFYSKDGAINHVALYIGGGKVVHASSPESGIKISEWNYRTPTKCRRVIADQ